MAAARLRTRCEEEQAARRDVALKDRKHRALFVLIEMEEAVPGDDRVEAAAEGERAHVGFDPGAFGEALPADGDHGGRGVHAGDGVAALDEMARDRLAGAAAKIEDTGARLDDLT